VELLIQVVEVDFQEALQALKKELARPF
jgi:hypothetical protein